MEASLKDIIRHKHILDALVNMIESRRSVIDPLRVCGSGEETLAHVYRCQGKRDGLNELISELNRLHNEANT